LIISHHFDACFNQWLSSVCSTSGYYILCPENIEIIIEFWMFMNGLVHHQLNGSATTCAFINHNLDWVGLSQGVIPDNVNPSRIIIVIFSHDWPSIIVNEF
jgi:hypothetical protein